MSDSLCGNDSTVNVGVAHGRFQVFHNDHLRYVLAAKRRCRHLVIGITSPDPSRAPFEAIDPHRKAPQANPFTYYERMSMISACMYAEGLNGKEFSIVPFPIESPARLHNYAPSDAVYYMTVYDAWGDEKVSRLQRLGLHVEVLWRSTNKDVSGSAVRASMAAAGCWREMVPTAVADYLAQHGLLARVRANKNR